MAAVSSMNSPPEVKTASKAWSLIVAGYSTAAVGLVAFLTFNGASGTPVAATIGTAGSVVIGFLLLITGMLQPRRALGPTKSAARSGFAMQAFGLLGLLLGVVLVVAVPSLSSYFLSAAFVVISAVLAIAGALFLRGHYANTTQSNTRIASYMILGTALIFLGAGLIVGSNIAYEYLISQVENTVYVDIGATVSACGCVLAAYSFFVSRSRSV
jgi:small basic protein